MSRSSKIIPEFMSNNKDHTFRLIMPLNLQLDHDNYANSYFLTAVRNETTQENFLAKLAPEIFFTHYPLQKYFKNGRLDKNYTNKEIVEEKNISIDTNISSKYQNVKISDILSDNNIGTLLGWKFTYLNYAKNINCYIIKSNDKTFIIPHYAIAIYYYYRFTAIREAVLNCKLDDLYVSCICNPNDASIILKEPKTDTDAAFIHRFVCQKDANKSFENIGKQIINHLRFMKDNYSDTIVKYTPIKANFPIKDKFNISARLQHIVNENTNEEYYYIHEIINDTSYIGFNKFTKFLEKNKSIVEIENIDQLQTIKQNIPEETTEILKTTNATKIYQQKNIYSNNKRVCGSLLNIDIQSKDLEKDTIKKLIQIKEQIQVGNTVDQSLTNSSINGETTIRKTVVSTKPIDIDKQLTSKENTYNFDEFYQYTNFIKSQSIIQDFHLYDIQKLPKVMCTKNHKLINKKCLIKGQPKQYITCTFKYKNLYVGLLELENSKNTSSSTWVIVSTNYINKSVFSLFISHYLNDNYSIREISNLYQNNPNIRFHKKNHEKAINLTNDLKTRWLSGLLGKIVI